MEDIRNLLYLTVLARALRRFSEAAGQSGALSEIESMIKNVERQQLSLIEKAEALSLGDMVFPQEGYSIPKTEKKCLLEQIDAGTQNLMKYSQSLIPLTLNDNFFPTVEEANRDNIDTLWQKVKENLSNLQHGDTRVLAENILNILFRYTVTIPSNDRSLDVSLYDQTRTAAAIAVCLYDYEASGDDDDNEFLLVGGDFSGIQQYIYQIVSKYAGKNLKGRSFYLSLLSDAVVRMLLSRLSLYRANIVYNSGGSFYLLAPNTPNVRATLDKTISEIEKNIFKSHGTQIFVAIDSMSLSSAEISNNDGKRSLSEIWQQLFKLRDQKKNRRYVEGMKNDFESFFTPQSINGTKRDVITGEDFAKGEKSIKFGDGGFISELNDAQIKLGRDLKDTDILVVSDTDIDILNRNTHICPANLGQYYYLANFCDLEEFDGNHRNITFVYLNGKDFSADYVLDKSFTNNICSMQFYGGNRFNGKTFEDMCDNEGFSRLGVLRMDVDNLGTIFQSGIPEKEASLSRYAALSRSFDYFFSGYLNVICQNENIADRSFIVYSGGDDVFIVGSWDTAIEIAWQIQTDFRRYTCQNSAFSISGGIAILDAKFPIIAGAEESAQEEGKAKNHVCNGQNKNSISFFSMPLNWQHEFPIVKKLKEKIEELLMTNKLPKSFLSKIIEHSIDASFNNHKVTNFKVYWHLAYDLKRMKERYRSEEVQALLDNCVSEVCHSNGRLNGETINTNYNSLELWAFACRWAEVQYRKYNN